MDLGFLILSTLLLLYYWLHPQTGSTYNPKMAAGSSNASFWRDRISFPRSAKQSSSHVSLTHVDLGLPILDQIPALRGWNHHGTESRESSQHPPHVVGRELRIEAFLRSLDISSLMSKCYKSP